MCVSLLMSYVESFMAVYFTYILPSELNFFSFFFITFYVNILTQYGFAKNVLQ